MAKVANLPENIYQPEHLERPRILHSGHLLLITLIGGWIFLVVSTGSFAYQMGFHESLHGPRMATEYAVLYGLLWKALALVAVLGIPFGYWLAQQENTEPARFYIGLSLFAAPVSMVVWTYAHPYTFPFFEYLFWAYLYLDAPELQDPLRKAALAGGGAVGIGLVAIWLVFGKVEWKLSTAFGSASWGDGSWFHQGPPQGSIRKKLSGSEDRGFPIGWKGGRMLYDRSGLHMLVIAPTGAGKTTGFVVPALLLHEGSAFVVDIKRELYHVTARRRHEINGCVHRIDPFGNNTAQYNPLDLITVEEGKDETALDDARRVANMLVIETGKENNPFFPRTARQLVTGLVLWVCVRYNDEPQHRHLGKVRDLLMQGTNDLEATFDAMRYVRRGGESVRRQVVSKANQFKGMNSREFEAVLATAREQTAFLESEPVRHTLEDTTVSFGDMKREEDGATFFLVLPDERLSTYNRWLRLMIVSAQIELLRIEKAVDHPILFMLDEFPALERFEEVKDGLARHRSAGIQYVLVCQSDKQLHEHYKEGTDSIRGNTQCKFMWAPSTHESREQISKLAGKMTVGVEGSSKNQSRSHGGREGSNKTVSRSIQERERPLVTPEEAGRMPDDYAFIFTRHQPPLVVRRPNYVRDDLFKEHADPHPLHSKKSAFLKAQKKRKELGIGYVSESKEEPEDETVHGYITEQLKHSEWNKSKRKGEEGGGAPPAPPSGSGGSGNKNGAPEQDPDNNLPKRASREKPPEYEREPTSSAGESSTGEGRGEKQARPPLPINDSVHNGVKPNVVEPQQNPTQKGVAEEGPNNSGVSDAKSSRDRQAPPKPEGQNPKGTKSQGPDGGNPDREGPDGEGPEREGLEREGLQRDGLQRGGRERPGLNQGQSR